MKLYPAGRFTMSLGNRKKTCREIAGKSAGQGLQPMQHWRHHDDFAAFPFAIRIARAGPLTAFELSLLSDAWLLLCRTSSQKEPGIKTPRRKWRCHPAPG